MKSPTRSLAIMPAEPESSTAPVTTMRHAGNTTSQRAFDLLTESLVADHLAFLCAFSNSYQIGRI